MKKSCSFSQVALPPATRDVDGERGLSLSLSIAHPAFRIPKRGAAICHLPFSILRIIALCAAVLLLAGCAGYRLGPVNGETAGDKSVEILPFNNQTLQPRLGDAVTHAVRDKLQTDGTYRLATGNGDSDIVVSGVITSYSRSGLSFLSSDVLTANNYRIAMSAHVTFRERATGKVLLDKDVTGYTMVHVGSDLASAERQAMPLLADDFARKLTQMLTEGMW